MTSKVRRKDIDDIQRMVQDKLELYINYERRENRFNPQGADRTTPRMHTYDFIYKVLERTELEKEWSKKEKKENQRKEKEEKEKSKSPYQVKPALYPTTRRVVGQREVHRLTANASQVIESLPLEKLYMVHRYRPHSADVPLITDTGKIQNYRRHVGCALHSEAYIKYYKNQGLDSGNAHRSARLQQLTRSAQRRADLEEQRRAEEENGSIRSGSRGGAPLLQRVIEDEKQEAHYSSDEFEKDSEDASQTETKGDRSSSRQSSVTHDEEISRKSEAGYSNEAFEAESDVSKVDKKDSDSSSSSSSSSSDSGKDEEKKRKKELKKEKKLEEKESDSSSSKSSSSSCSDSDEEDVGKKREKQLKKLKKKEKKLKKKEKKLEKKEKELSEREKSLEEKERGLKGEGSEEGGVGGDRTNGEVLEEIKADTGKKEDEGSIGALGGDGARDSDLGEGNANESGGELDDKNVKNEAQVSGTDKETKSCEPSVGNESPKSPQTPVPRKISKSQTQGKVSPDGKSDRKQSVTKITDPSKRKLSRSPSKDFRETGAMPPETPVSKPADSPSSTPRSPDAVSIEEDRKDTVSYISVEYAQRVQLHRNTDFI